MSAATFAGLVVVVLAGAVLLLCVFAWLSGINGGDLDPPARDKIPEADPRDMIDIKSLLMRWED